MKKNIRDFIVGCVGLVSGLAIYFVIIPATIPSLEKLDPYTYSMSQRADYIPKIWTLILIISSFGLIIESLTGSSSYKNEKIDLKEILHVVALLSIMVGYVILLTRAGFLFTSTICLATTLFLFDYKYIKKLVLLSIILNIVLFFVLKNLLYVEV